MKTSGIDDSRSILVRLRRSFDFAGEIGEIVLESGIENGRDRARRPPFSGGLRRAESACAHSLFQLFKSAQPFPQPPPPIPPPKRDWFNSVRRVVREAPWNSVYVIGLPLHRSPTPILSSLSPFFLPLLTAFPPLSFRGPIFRRIVRIFRGYDRRAPTTHQLTSTPFAFTHLVRSPIHG